MYSFRSLTLTRLLLLGGLFVLAGTSGLIAQSSDETSNAAADSAAAAEILRTELLRPGDIVRLRIWREPDLSGEYQVDETGTVVFPLIGPRQVLKESPVSLKERLISDYRVYLRNPSIDVTLLRRVNVLGAVARPGLYPIDPTMTLADALALAGGATPIGDPDRVHLIRNGETLTSALNQRTRIGDLSIRSGDQLVIPERSWIARNSNIVAAAITGTISLIVALVVAN